MNMPSLPCPVCKGVGTMSLHEVCPTCVGSGFVPQAVADVLGDPETMALIRRGYESAKAGELIPWSELKRKYKLEADAP